MLAQGAQQLGDLGGAGGIKGGLHKVFQRGILAQTAKVKVLFMYHTDDVVNGAVVDGQTGISRFRKGIGHLIQREIVPFVIFQATQKAHRPSITESDGLDLLLNCFISLERFYLLRFLIAVRIAVKIADPSKSIQFFSIGFNHMLIPVK